MYLSFPHFFPFAPLSLPFYISILKLLCIPIYVDLDEKQVQMHNKILEDIDEIKKEILKISLYNKFIIL